jgi:sugar phosphate isomerase/epimerase
MKLKTGLAVGGFGLNFDDSLRLISKAGFDSFFSGTASLDELKRRRALADQLGLVYSSLHAPFTKAADMWSKGRAGDIAEQEIHDCIDLCYGIEVPILVVHPFIGFDKHSPTDEGLERFKSLAEYASEKNVKLAIENVEGEEYFDCLMKGLTDFESVGFCLDTGHQMCYNRGRDFLSEMGDRLIYTHINDNMGITYQDGRIFWHDDAHLLPFDGVQNWDKLASQIKKTGYDGFLTLELSKVSKPNRTCNDIYNSLTAEEYVFEAASRIRRFADMVEKSIKK